MSAESMAINPGVTDLRLRPQRWILVGHDEAWRAAAEAHLAAMTHPMAKWRQDAKLIVVTAPDAFEVALQAAVDCNAPEVAALTQEGIADLGPAFGRVFPVESRLTLPRLYTCCTLETIEHLLVEPESHVIWRWLMSGRKRMPEVALDSAELRKEAGEAHAAWAEDYRRSWTEDELDEMFGNGQHFGVETGDGEQRPADWTAAGEIIVPIPDRANVEDSLDLGAPKPRGRPGFDGAFRMAAATRGASRRRPAYSDQRGQVSRRDGSGSVSWELSFLPRHLDEGEGGRFDVSLSVSEAEWRGAGYLPPMLSIHGPDMLPVLVRTPAWNEWTARHDGRRETKCEVRADGAVIKAIAARGAMVRMVYRRGEATDQR